DANGTAASASGGSARKSRRSETRLNGKRFPNSPKDRDRRNWSAQTYRPKDAMKTLPRRTNSEIVHSLSALSSKHREAKISAEPLGTSVPRQKSLGTRGNCIQSMET